MNEKKIKHIVSQIIERSRTRGRKCFSKGCENQAIKSHVLQKNGLLNKITDNNNHLYEVKRLNFPSPHFSIRKEGINQAMSFYGFCSHHDSEIFREIENEYFDLNSYRSLALLSYRSILKEYREKEIAIDVYTRASKSSLLKGYFDLDEILVKIQAETLLLWDLEFLLASITEDLASDSEHFTFATISTRSLDVCASAVYSIESIADTFANASMNLNDKRLLQAIIINICPSSNSSSIVLGIHKESGMDCKNEISTMVNGDAEALLKYLSDLLIKKFSTWACSPLFHDHRINPKKTEIIKLMNHFTKRTQFSKDQISLNLFELD